MHDVIMGSKNRTELDLSATATVRYSEAAENASIKKNSPAAQALHDESPPPDNLDSNLLKQFDAVALLTSWLQDATTRGIRTIRRSARATPLAAAFILSARWQP